MRTRYFLILLFVAFVSCTKDEDLKITDVLDKVTVVDDDNKLRNKVELELKQEASVQVEYWKSGEPEQSLKTPFTEAGITPTVTLILLEPDAVYDFKVTAKTDNGTIISDTYSFTTRSLPDYLSVFENQLDNSDFHFDGYVAVATNSENSYIYILNDSGTIVWYQAADDDKDIDNFSFDPVHNTFQCILGQNPNEAFGGDEIQIIDLYGNTLFKRHYEELTHPDVHHDFIRLSDNLLMINRVKKEYDLTSLGGNANETITGDGLTMMDMDGNIKWEWSCFDVYDPRTYPYLMEDGDLVLIPREDLLHLNSVNPDVDGNYLVSSNRLNQIWKIDATTGELIYRLGEDGNISMSAEAYSSGTHSVFVNSDNEIMFLDNGKNAGVTRAISVAVDETSKSADIKKIIEFPEALYSKNQGSAYMVDPDHILFGSALKKTIAITDLSGNPVWEYRTDLVFYRAYYIDELSLDK